MSKVDSTGIMFLLVFGFILLASLFKNVQVLALGGLALILAMLMLKIVYLEPPVLVAIAVLTVFAVMGDSILEKAEKIGVNIPFLDRLSEEDKQKIKQAYADQFAPEGCYIVVNHYDVNQWVDRVDPSVREKFGPDRDYQIWIYGADSISDYYTGEERPRIEQQIKDVIENNKIWVKVRVPDLGDVWVHVKAVLREMSWGFDPDRECVYCAGEKKTCHPEIDWWEVLT